MDLDQTYVEILSEIAKGHRALKRFNSAELEELNQLLLTETGTELEKVLCLIEHSASLYGNFEAHLIQLLKTDLSPTLIVFALNAARKHIVEARFQKGSRLEFDFLEILKELLHHKNPEVVEWTLRLIESCGNQGVYFLREFDKIKPPPWKWFNPHQRSVREIITLLERRWSPSENKS